MLAARLGPSLRGLCLAFQLPSFSHLSFFVSVIISDFGTAVSDSESTVSDSETAVLDSETAVSDSETTVSESETAVSDSVFVPSYP